MSESVKLSIKGMKPEQELMSNSETGGTGRHTLVGIYHSQAPGRHTLVVYIHLRYPGGIPWWYIHLMYPGGIPWCI